MPTVYKILGQSAPAANTNTIVYSVPAGNSAVISTITVANLSVNNVTYRLAVQKANATISSNHYIAYNTTVFGNDTTALTLGITLGETDVISANVSDANVAINIFGSEIY